MFISVHIPQSFYETTLEWFILYAHSDSQCLSDDRECRPIVQLYDHLCWVPMAPRPLAPYSNPVQWVEIPDEG